MSPPPSSSLSRRWTPYSLIDAAVPLILTSLGLLHRTNPRLWYQDLLICVACIVLPVLAGAGVVTILAGRTGARIQGPRVGLSMIAREAFETARSMYVVSCLAAWPLTQYRLGQPTGLLWSASGPGQLAWLSLQTLVGVLVIDAWLYWKHRMLHTRLLFGFHKPHHAFRNPTPFAGFAVAPVEALLTFWPLLLLCIPAATHYAPLYFFLVVAFINLNFYLHCGVTLGWPERLMPRLFLNTSAFHNVHHARVTTHFGEALFLWDRICGTSLSDEEFRPAAASTGVD